MGTDGGNPMPSQDVPRMTAEQLYTRMRKGEPVVVLDVRTAAAVSYQPDQIPGTRWLPLAEVVEQAAVLPRNATIVTYCT